MRGEGEGRGGRRRQGEQDEQDRDGAVGEGWTREGMSMAGELWRLDGVALAALIRAGKVSAREAVAAHLERLHAVNPQLNAVVRTLDAQALAEADAADRSLRAGEVLGSLHGLPVTTKVNSDQAGLPTDNGVEMYRDLIASEDSPQVGSLRRAGAIVIGRTNTPA